MYLPPQFDDAKGVHAQRLMQTHPFASLISADDHGFPFVTHLPLHWEARAEGEFLLGHVARGNPHWRYLQVRPKALVTFLGPHAYMSPAVYPDLARVPTWNYLAVHCTVEAVLIDQAEQKDALLKKLIGDHEPAYAAQWGALDDAFARKMLAGVVGFALRIAQVECKIKLNQHRPESHTAMHARYSAGGPQEQALARWMEQLGLASTGPEFDCATARI